MQITKTKYGYFVCRKQTYLKVKQLYGYFHRAVQQAANWRRWYTKKPQNRFIQLRTNEDGKTRLGVILVRPEPRLVPVFSIKNTIISYHNRSGHYVEGGVEVEKVSVCDMGILGLYDVVRKPKKYQKHLSEVTTTIAELNDMLLQIHLAGW